MRNNLNQSDEALEASAKAAEATLKELRKDINFRGYNQHILISALIISHQIKDFNIAANTMIEKLSDMAESMDFISSEYEGKQRFNRVTDKEQKSIKDALTKLFLDGMIDQPSEQEHQLAMARIESIANGWCWNA
jgi:hypothetical protein